MFVAAVGGVVGVVVIGAVNHSDYSDHYNYSEYGDSSELDEIKKLEDEVNKKEKGIEVYKRDAKEKYQARLNELKQEETYASLDAAKANILEDIKKEMQTEVAAEIQDEKQQLEYIDQMIARINEIELAENHQGGKA
ncbi:hypothetical protein [Selenomonas bovis]|uniref:hypothetical protein n=1 Tax=Selenomonas bovis TaxID=416586 RepID=UPI0004E16CC4|nr:hypothetical protein [Selenomonas bovis]